MSYALILEIDRLLRAAHPEYLGRVSIGDDIAWLGYTPDAAELAALTAQAEANIILAAQQIDATLQAVEFTRPLDLAAFMTADQAAIDDYIAANGVNAAIYSIIRVLKYLTACKDRAKITA